METNLVHGGDITYQIIGRVHRRLGPGLLKSVYEACLCHKLRRSETPFQRQERLPVLYDDTKLDCGYVAEAQLLTYLRLTTCRTGVLINFNTVSLTDGIRRRVFMIQIPCNPCSGSCCDPIRVLPSRSPAQPRNTSFSPLTISLHCTAFSRAERRRVEPALKPLAAESIFLASGFPLVPMPGCMSTALSDATPHDRRRVPRLGTRTISPGALLAVARR